MPLTRQRLTMGVFLILSLLVIIPILRLAIEWRQALDNIDAMIVTPAALPEETAVTYNVHQTDETVSSASSSTGHSYGGSALETPDSAPVLTTTEPAALSDGDLNILLLGADARPEEEIPTRTDAIVLVHLDADSHQVSMLSLPRDLWVTYPRGYGEGRINAAYAIGENRFGPGGGAALVKSTISKLLDLEVDYFVLINFQGFEKLIDLIGDITVDVPSELYDPAYPTSDYQTIEIFFREGIQRMDGERALMYARTRHADNDFGRNQRQQQVLMAIFAQIRDQGLLQQMTGLDDYTGALRDYVRTDMSRGVMVELATWGRSLQSESIQRYAIDSSMIVDLDQPATFAADPQALRRVIGQFTSEAVSSAGGE